MACAVRKGKKKVEEGEPDENWQPTVSVMPYTSPLVEPDALESQLTSCKHSTSVQRPSPRKLSLLNSCVIAGPRPRGAWCWGGVGQVGGVVNKSKALLGDAHCYTDKVVKEETALCLFVIQLQRRIHQPLAETACWSGFRQTSGRHFVNYGRHGTIVCGGWSLLTNNQVCSLLKKCESYPICLNKSSSEYLVKIFFKAIFF